MIFIPTSCGDQEVGWLTIYVRVDVNSILWTRKHTMSSKGECPISSWHDSNIINAWGIFVKRLLKDIVPPRLTLLNTLRQNRNLAIIANSVSCWSCIVLASPFLLSLSFSLLLVACLPLISLALSPDPIDSAISESHFSQCNSPTIRTHPS